MGLIGDIRALVRKSGKRADAGSAASIAAVEGALSKLRTERSAAQSAIAEASERRRELLLTDNSDAAITSIETETDLHHRTLERLALLETELLMRLDGLRDVAKQQRWRELREQYDSASVAYVASIRDTLSKLQTLMHINDQARAAGFEHQVIGAFSIPPRIIDPGAIDRFEAEAERQSEGYIAPVAPPSPPAAKVPLAKHRAVVEITDSPAPRPTREVRSDPPPADASQAQIEFYRSADLPDGTRATRGDRVTLASVEAHRMVERGVADYVTGDAA